MDRAWSLSRRRLLVGCGGVAAAGALAGCTGDGGDSENGDEGNDTANGKNTADGGDNNTTDSDGNNSDGSAEDSDTGDGNGDDTELDRREANVVGVSVTEQAEDYRFEVTLHHDDEGEEGYANWWQVERLDGTRLGRRDLAHPHSVQPFTRSESLQIPDGVSCVVVRGHDQTHGYGGRAVLLRLDSGETRTVEQGSTRESFETSDCPG